MDTASHSGRSWLAALLLVLLAVCAGALVKAFWSATQPQPVPPAALSQPDEDHLPPLSVDEALRILADPEASSLERTPAADVIARQEARAVPQLVALLDSPSLKVQISAVALLGRLGPAAAVAGPRLQELCTSPEPQIRESAVPAAMRVHHDPEALRQTLREALALGPESVAINALNAMSQLDPQPIEDLEHVATTAESSGLKGVAVGYLAPHALRDRELLRRLLKKGVQFPGKPALAHQLEEIVHSEPDDAIHLAALLQLVLSNNPPQVGGVYQLPTARYFREMADGAKRHRDAPAFERLAILLSGPGERIQPVLRGLLQSKHHATRCHAALMLTATSREPQKMLPLLRELLKTDAPWQLRCRARRPDPR